MSDRVNLVAPASPVQRARYSTNWDRLGNSNVLRLPVFKFLSANLDLNPDS